MSYVISTYNTLKIETILQFYLLNNYFSEIQITYENVHCVQSSGFSILKSCMAVCTIEVYHLPSLSYLCRLKYCRCFMWLETYLVWNLVTFFPWHNVFFWLYFTIIVACVMFSWIWMWTCHNMCRSEDNFVQSILSLNFDMGYLLSRLPTLT